MQNRATIKLAFERNARALALRPGPGQGTAVTRVRWADGLTCHVEDGPWKLTVNMGKRSGGDGRGPNPGVLGRGALGSCLTICYAMWAAKLGVPIGSLEVEVQADYDTRGLYGVANVTPGYTEVRYVVRIESEAPELDVLRMLDHADAHTPFHAVFSEPLPLRREVRIATPQE